METNSTSAVCTVNGDCGTGVVIAPTVRDPNASVGSGGADVGYTGPTVAEIIDALAGVIEFSHLAQSLRTRINTITTLEAGFNNLQSQVVTDNSVMAQQLIGLRDDLTNAVAYINNQTNIQISEREALVNSVNQMVAQIDGSGPDGWIAALEEESTVRATQTGALFAEKTVKTDLAGNVAGYGLSSYADPTEALSDFRVAADRFSIAPPAYVSPTPPPAEQMHDGKVWVDTSQGSEAAVTKWWSSDTASWSLTPVTAAQPFIYLTTPTTLPDGTVVEPGLYVNSASITKLRADQIDTRGLTIKDAAGNIIFGSGTGLDWGSISGASKPQDGATRNVFKGAWATSTAYIAGDVVLDGGNGWSAKSNHTSASGNRPPSSGLGNTWWAAYTVKGDTGSTGPTGPTGPSGVDGLTIVAPNAAHTIPASSNGDVSSYVGSGTTIQVYEGSTALYAVASLTTHSQFTVGVPSVSGASTITVGGVSYSSKVATVAQHSSMSTSGDVCVITYPISVKRADGTTVSMSFQQTLTKSKAGATGTQGIPGTPGTNGVTLYTWIKYASTPTSGISDFPEGKAYIGVAYNKTTSVESIDYADYTWSLIKGEQGVQGPQGVQGQTTYTWIKYADTSDGTGLSDSPTGKKYIGIAPNKLSNVESTTPGDYTWALIQGPQGVQGIQGAKGNDGVTLYTWVKYADTPTTGMSDFPSGKKYLGIAYNKTTADESLVYSDYTWSLIQGDQGVQGPTGPQGQTTYTWVKYADDSSGTGMSDSSAGKKYIGIAPNKLSATESSSPGEYTWSLIQGPQGDEGPPGPAVVVLTDRTPAFTSTDGVLDSGQSNIVFTASVFGIDSPTYQWSVTGAQTAPTVLTGSTLTLTAAQFGVATSVIVKCTVNGLYSDQEPVHRLNKSTAAAGATVGAKIGNNVTLPDGSVLNSTDFVHRLSKIDDTNIGTFMSAAAIGNAYIGNAAVNTLKIAGNAVTVPITARYANTIPGSGSGTRVAEATITLDTPGYVYTIFTANQTYGSGVRTSVTVLYLGGQSITVGGEAVTTNICVSDAAYFPAGTHTIAVDWMGQDSGVNLQQRTLFVMGVKR